MVYLHPSQRAIVRARVQRSGPRAGGPGTGKTVVALHRARRLARGRPTASSVLLTTFLRTLPKVWQGLMGTMDPRALERLDVVNIDALAMRIVRRPQARCRSWRSRPPLARGFAAEAPRAWIRVRRQREPPARGVRRVHHRAGHDRPRDLLRASPARRRHSARAGGARAGLGGLRGVPASARPVGASGLRARCGSARSNAVEQGHGERYAGVIVDEAQDITEVGIRLLFGSTRARSIAGSWPSGTASSRSTRVASRCARSGSMSAAGSGADRRTGATPGTSGPPHGP